MNRSSRPQHGMISIASPQHLIFHKVTYYGDCIFYTTFFLQSFLNNQYLHVCIAETEFSKRQKLIHALKNQKLLYFKLENKYLISHKNVCILKSSAICCGCLSCICFHSRVSHDSVMAAILTQQKSKYLKMLCDVCFFFAL